MRSARLPDGVGIPALAACAHDALVEVGTQVWIDAVLPVEVGETKVLSLIRQVRIVIGLFYQRVGNLPLANCLAKAPWNNQALVGAVDLGRGFQPDPTARGDSAW